jgi:glycosyltransferase involved in cell wall biosynthesis
MELPPKKIKIAFVAENALGGIISVITGLISLLDKDKFEFSVALIDLEWRKVTPAASVFESLGISPYLLSIGNSENKFHALNRFQKKFLKHQDLVVASDKYEIIAYCIGRLQIPLIMMVHNDSEYDSMNCFQFRDVVDVFVPISDKIRDNLVEKLGSREGARIKKLNHALPSPVLPFSDPFSEKFVIAFVGRFNEFKGVKQLIAIGDYLYGKSTPVNFILITNGIDEDTFMKKWKYNESTAYFSNISNLEVQNLLSRSNVLLMPSTGGEGFPVALVEAMRRGLVPVCSALKTGFPEVITDGDSGFLIELDRIDRFGETIISLSRDRNRLHALSKRALETVEEKFNPQRNAVAYEELFMETIENTSVKRYPSVSMQLGKLDKPYIPGIIFKFLRRMKRANPTTTQV